MSLFGCEVNIGIATDANSTVMEFYGDGDYLRKVTRGKSTCFECIDQKDIVMQAVSATRDSEQKETNMVR